VKKLTLILFVVLAAVLLLPAMAGAKTPTLKQLAKTVTTLQKTVKAQAIAIKSIKSTVAAQATTLTNAAPLLAIAPYVSLNPSAMNGVKGPNIVFQGANVHVRSTSAEDDTSGLGNLIVGWNPLPLGTLPSPFRSGSNNLVVGADNDFTSYGGFVAGFDNTASGHYASVSGGERNTAGGDWASVSGGWGNTASQQHASVSGGSYNTANGQYASVSGGRFNMASGDGASVSGGKYVTVSVLHGWGAGTLTSQ
jgi:hypothetical protein